MIKIEMEVFIVCHDQEIILNYEENNKFRDLALYRYLFVGSGDISKISTNNKVIICRNLTHNIENYPHLVSYTAWYALAKNNLIRTKYISILEYDVDLSQNFYEKNINLMENNEDAIIGYVVFPLNHPIYFDATPYLRYSLKEVYKIDVDKLVYDWIKKTSKNKWCSTSNCTLSAKNLIKFVDWFWPLANVFKMEKLGAHVHERCIKIFAILFQFKTFYISDVLKHWQKKSHKIEALI